METASGGAWVNRTPRQVIWMRFNESTPGDIGHAVSIVEIPSQVLMITVATSPPCGLNASLQVANKKQSTSPALVGNTPKLDTVVDGKFPNDMDYTSVSIKVINNKLSDNSSGDL